VHLRLIHFARSHSNPSGGSSDNEPWGRVIDRKTTIALGAVCGVLVVATVAVLFFARSGTPPPDAAAAPPTNAAVIAEKADESAFSADFIDRLPRLLERARAGDVTAIDRLTDAWSTCDGAPRSAADAFAEADRNAKILGLDKPDREPLVKRFRACVSFRSTLHESGEREIVRLAAEAKRPYARERFLRSEREYLRRETTLPEEIAVYREHAQRYLAEMIAEHNPRALYDTAAAYSDGSVFDANPMLATAYFGAYADVAGADAVRKRELDKVMSALDIDQRTESQRRRAEIVRDYCANGGCPGVSVPADPAPVGVTPPATPRAPTAPTGDAQPDPTNAASTSSR
jgi:hypothetical protein